MQDYKVRAFSPKRDNIHYTQTRSPPRRQQYNYPPPKRPFSPTNYLDNRENKLLVSRSRPNVSYPQPDTFDFTKFNNQLRKSVQEKRTINAEYPIFGRATVRARSPARRQPKESYYISHLVDALSRPFSQDFFDQCFREHFYQLIKVLNSRFRGKPMNKQLQLSKNLQNQAKNTLVLDLDETLVHSNNGSEIKQFDFQVKIVQNGKNHNFKGFIRPWCKEFLTGISEFYQIIIYTASHTAYAQAVVNQVLDPQGKYISHVLGRQLCGKSQQGFYYKQLGIMNRNIKSLIVVDNSPYSMCFCIPNAVPIIPFFDNKMDRELRSLFEFLKEIHKSSDVRNEIENHFKYKLLKGKSMQEAYQFIREKRMY